MQQNSQQRRSCKKKENNLKSSSLPINFHAGGLMDWRNEEGRRGTVSVDVDVPPGWWRQAKDSTAWQRLCEVSSCFEAMNMQLWKFYARALQNFSGNLQIFYATIYFTHYLRI